MANIRNKWQMLMRCTRKTYIFYILFSLYADKPLHEKSMQASQDTETPVLQKTAFHVPKDGLLQPERPSLTRQKTAFCNKPVH